MIGFDLQERRYELAFDEVGVMLAFTDHSPTFPLHEHLGGAGAGVVVGGHRETVGSGPREGEQVSFGGIGEVSILRKVVAALADRADEVGVVESRAEEVVHTSIGDEKALVAAALAVEHACQEHARVAGYVAAHLAEYLGTRSLQGRPDGFDELLGGGDLLVLIADPQTPTDVEVLDVEAAHP